MTVRATPFTTLLRGRPRSRCRRRRRPRRGGSATWLLTPSPTSGGIEAPSSGHRAPVTVTPAARAVHRQHREHRAGRQVELDRAGRVHDVQLVAAPPRLQRRRTRPAPARRARRARRRRGRGGHPGRRRAGSAAAPSWRRGRRPARCRSPPLSTGWRTTSVCSDAHARPIAEIESRSPTRTLGSSPAALAWSRPPSAAMIVASRGMAATARRSSGAAPVITTDGVACSWAASSAGITRFRFSGRRRQPPSQPTGPASSPCWSSTSVAARASRR